MYTDTKASTFDQNHTQGPDTVIVPPSYFHNPSTGQKQDTRPSSD